MIGSAWPLRGGLANFNERLVREFNTLGWKSQIYTFSLQYPKILFPGKTQYSDEPAPEDLDIHVKVNSINPLNWILIGWKIRQMRPDMVVIKFWIPFMAPCLGTISRIIRGNKHTRVISIIDNIIPHEKRPGDMVLAKYWVKSVDGFIAMSRAVLTDLDSFDKSKPKVFCPHPIYDNFGKAVEKNAAKEMLSLDKDLKYVLFFGFIRDYKGLDLLIQAFADERLRQSDIRLLVAGEFYTDPKPYHELIQTLDLSSNIVLHTDFINDSDVYKYFCACDIVAQPYKHATQSGVTQIAYHFDKPMIITNVGGLAEFVPDGKAGFVIEPEPSAIASAIYRFYNLNKEKEFVENTHIEKRKYSWKSMVDSVLSV
jgi:glycosyltransferase involved in cell wall biosynthesis